MILCIPIYLMTDEIEMLLVKCNTFGVVKKWREKQPNERPVPLDVSPLLAA